ncbi:MAG TPA: hypothetical protein DCE52_14120, partial [Rhodobacteraceae bacterium]|nr:hypothetical protein [Paracoccaceae bacterium]
MRLLKGFVASWMSVEHSYYAAKKRRQVIDVERLCQRAKIQELFEDSRRSAGSRTLVLQMKDAGFPIGRFKVRSLMRES